MVKSDLSNIDSTGCSGSNRKLYGMLKIQFLKILMIFASGLLSCSGAYNQSGTYNKLKINEPYKIIKLPHELREISGLSFYRDKKLFCLHDEKADVFILDYETEKVDKLINTDIFGDFEGIEYVHDTLYVLKSNGNIYEFNLERLLLPPKKYKTFLSERNNTEGLGYDRITNSLLLACKNKGFVKMQHVSENERTVYQFSLDAKRLEEKPLITISLERLRKKFGFDTFMPSAIAVHPVNNHFYILSSVGRLLLIIDRDHNILDAIKLEPSIYSQPEGICFDSEGKYLFISNEGKKSTGTLIISKTE